MVVLVGTMGVLLGEIMVPVGVAVGVGVKVLVSEGSTVLVGGMGVFVRVAVLLGGMGVAVRVGVLDGCTLVGVAVLPPPGPIMRLRVPFVYPPPSI
jgi:hypothetical protein